MTKLPGDLTCIVPTYHRPTFLRRLLTFWDQVSAPAPIVVVDSSKGESREENQRIVQEFSPRLPLSYEHLDLPIIVKMAAAVNLVKTPYVFFCADDDFILPNAANTSLEFLRRSPGYISAQGMIVSVRSVTDYRCRIMRGYNLASDSPEKRFAQIATYWYSTFYAINRTAELQECFRVTLEGPKYEQARIYPEFMLSQMTALLGKVKFLPEIYGVWQAHELNEHRNLPAVQELEDGVKHYAHFQQVLATELARYSKLDQATCLRIVDRNFASLIKGRVSNQRLTAKAKSEMMRVVRRVYGLFKKHEFLERRTLTPRDHRWHDPVWQLAYRLIRDFPNGLSESDFHSRRDQSDRTIAA